MIKTIRLLAVLIFSTAINNLAMAAELSDQLLRDSYLSVVDQKEHDFFVYLPQGYLEKPDKRWPVMLFLHGNGERGDGKSELDYVMHHGPLYEAWVQKRDLPFIIVVPQLPMFGQDKLGLDYIDNRNAEDIPRRQESGVPARPEEFTSKEKITGSLPADMTEAPAVLPGGWDLVEKDLENLLAATLAKYRTDSSRVYLTGISYGGFGTWYFASKHPQQFAAIAPVVGWGHPDLMAPIAKHQLPVWAFAGGRDSAVPLPYFFAGLNQLEALGHENVRFTVHHDMEHDTWRRVYAGQDIYSWLLAQQLSN